ncbi:MAG: hypothetical protein ACXQT5_06095 [Candidatus Syntropharchaeia archaeon]
MENRTNLFRPKPLMIFLAKFFLLSLILLILWNWIGKGYTIIVAHVTGIFLIPFGYHAEFIMEGGKPFLLCRGALIGLENTHLVNFNLVSFIALVLASPGIDLVKKGKIFLIGLPILFLMHIVDLAAHFPVYFYQSEVANFIVDSIGVWGVAVPFMIWFGFIYKNLFVSEVKEEEKVKGKKKYRCPICGAEKVGIVDHIKSVHGAEVFKEKEIKDFLKEIRISKKR